MNNADVVQYVDKISTEFSLVLIVEYFHESLVLLKRMMCWSLKDLIYNKVNMGKYHYSMTTEDRVIHRKWSSADYQLYDHFNKTFWIKVKAEGANFYDEVRHFTKIQQNVSMFCNFTGEKNSLQNGAEVQEDFIKFYNNEKLSISQSPFNEEFIILQSDCNLMNSDIQTLLKEQYNSRVPWKDTEPTTPNRGC